MSGAITKLQVGFAGFDLIANEGLPEGWATLVAGTSGSAKTVFATQFLAAGVMAGEPNGEYPFTVLPEQGIAVVPLSAMELTARSSEVRIPSGIAELDGMCGGGFFRDSVILVSGATGTGKTLMVTQFMAGGVDAGERCLLVAFEESREQLFRNASGWGIDFERREREGQLRVVCQYPETAGLEDHLIRMKETIDAFKPNRGGLFTANAAC